MGIAVLPRFRSYAHINELTCHKIIEPEPPRATNGRYQPSLWTVPVAERYGSSSADEPKG
jgi:hypothetical protein